MPLLKGKGPTCPSTEETFYWSQPHHQIPCLRSAGQKLIANQAFPSLQILS